MTRMQRGTAPTMDSSRAQIRGTAPRPIDRAAVAGNTDTMSSVAVKRTEMMSASTEHSREEIHHVYLEGAQGLRDDLPD